MLVIVKGSRPYVNAQLIKRKIRAHNLPQTNSNEVWLEVREEDRAKVIEWFAKHDECLWYSSPEE